MLKKLAITAAALGALAACDVSYPVAVVGEGQTVYRGAATATFLEGGFFHVTNGANGCRGQFTPSALETPVTFPVTCTNGLTGVGTATFQDARSGGGTITMQDGTRWQFIFGRGALQV